MGDEVTQWERTAASLPAGCLRIPTPAGQLWPPGLKTDQITKVGLTAGQIGLRGRQGFQGHEDLDEVVAAGSGGSGAVQRGGEQRSNSGRKTSGAEPPVVLVSVKKINQRDQRGGGHAGGVGGPLHVPRLSRCPAVGSGRGAAADQSVWAICRIRSMHLQL